MGSQMIHNVLTHNDKLKHGPYEGWKVKDVLAVDPEELTRYTANGCEPIYKVSPAVLKEAYSKSQEQLGWDEFLALWNRDG